MAIVRGSGGVLKAGHQIAATVGAWSADIHPVSDDVAMVQVEAQIVSRHPVYGRMAGLDLRLAIGNREWVWRDVSLTDGPLLTISLGRPVIH